MASFFEKLKKGMGVEFTEEELEKTDVKLTDVDVNIREKLKPVPKKKKLKKINKFDPAASATKIEIETATIEPEVRKEESKKTEKLESLPQKSEDNHRSFTLQNLASQEGQLAVDVYQTDKDLVIQSAVAGIKSEDLDISIEADAVLIRGNRKQPLEQGQKNYFYQECYWGPFSRQIILPEETDPSHAEATMKEGVLTIRIPKIERKKKRKITIKT